MARRKQERHYQGDVMTLIPADDAALIRAMDQITDEDIAASIHWLHEIADDRPIPAKKALQQKEKSSHGR